MDLGAVLAKYEPQFKQGNTTGFETEIDSQSIALTDVEVAGLRALVDDFPLGVREEIRRALFEAHLREFPYSRDRVAEYTRLDKIYSNESV